MTDDATIQAIREDITEIKHGVKNVQQTQTLVAERLTRLEERHNNQASAIERAFGAITDHNMRVQKLELEGPDSREMLRRLDELTSTVSKVDGEHKKYMHIAIGVGAVVSLLWAAGSAYVVNEIRKAGDALDAIPQIVQKQKRQDAINRVIIKKLGSDIDYIE